MRVLLFICLFSVFSALTADSVSAQETSLTLTPAIVEIAANPGDEVERFLQIKNTSESSLPVSITVQSAVVDGEISDLAMEDRYDVSDWVRFNEKTYLFAPNQTQKISFTVSVPESAGGGGHYASISVRALALEQAAGSQSKSLVFPEVSVPMFINVSGDVHESAQVLQQDLSPTFMTRGSVYVSQLTIENTGTIHNIVSPQLEVLKKGIVIAEYPLNPSVILPGTQKTFEVTWQAPDDYGAYSTRVTFPFGTDKVIVESDTESFYITPPLSILSLLAACTWLVIYLYPYRKNIRSSVKVLLGK